MRRSAAVLVLASVLAACGASPTPTPGGSAAPGATGGAAALQKGPVDPSVVASWRPQVALDSQAIGKEAAALEADLAKLVDAAGTYGPTATDEQTALDQAEAQALSKLRDQLQAKLGSAVIPDAALASYRVPGGAPTVHPAQGLLATSWLFVLLLSTLAIGTFDPQLDDVPEITLSQPLDATNAHGSLSGDATLTYSTAGGVVSARLDLTGSITATVASSGRQVTTSGQSTYAFTINPCPDPGGGVSGAVDITDRETTTSPGRLTLGWNITGHTDYAAQVNDQAELASMTAKATWDEQLTRTINQAHESDLGFSDSLTIGPGGQVAQGGSAFSITSIDGTVTGDQARASAGMAVLLGELTPYMLVLYASDVWKGGKCFEVRPDPKSAEVDAGSRTPVKVTVYHWVDKADVRLPVRASLSGPKQVDPSGQPVTSPATFTYTAGGPGTTGTVEFNVVSRRGIGSATGTYHVKGNLNVDIAGTLKMNSAGVWSYNLTVQGAAIELTAADDGTISATGQVTVKGTAKALIEPCTATINERIGVQARGQLQGPPDAQFWHVQFGPSSENNLGQVTKCPSISVPSSQGDYFGQWSSTLGYVDIPAAGGTVTRSGSSSGLLGRQATGTFVASSH